MKNAPSSHGIYMQLRATCAVSEETCEGGSAIAVLIRAMFDLHDLQNWMDALKASPPFAVALPILVATVFASLADWLERYLGMHPNAEEDREHVLSRSEADWRALVATGGRLFLPAPRRISSRRPDRL